MVTITDTNGTPILSLTDWAALGGPQSATQWRDGRSAKECARAWLRTGQPAVPAELAALFASHAMTAGLVVQAATPEVETSLDDLRGKGRFHDLVLEGDASGSRTVVCIEAKADERFGNDVVADARRKALAANPRSMVGQRIDLLTRALFAPGVAVDQLRYQLLYAVAATLIEARKRDAEVAVFVVHEFVFPGHVDAQKLADNAADLDAFVLAMGVATPPPLGQLVPVPAVPGGKFVPAGMPLLIGKVRHP